NQGLAPDLLVVEVNPHLAVPPGAGDLGNGSRAELPVPHAGPDGYHGGILRLVLGCRSSGLRTTGGRSAPGSRLARTIAHRTDEPAPLRGAVRTPRTPAPSA